MQLVLTFPALDPELFSIDIGGFTFALRWYALAYIVGILAGWRLAVVTVRRDRLWHGAESPLSAEGVEELITNVILGIIIGGRLGFVLFYQPGYYLAHPLEIAMLWQGGMSFHGGMIGVTTGGLIFAWRHRVPVLSVCDLMALCTPPGLLLGRLANFVNAELWGRPSDLPWAVIFPGEQAQNCPDVLGPCARHPSQLYEAGLEGLVLGGLLILLVYRFGWLRRPGAIMGMFLVGYGVARMFVELFRQADPQFIGPANPLGHVLRFAGTGLSMGQALSLPMIVLGLVLILWPRRRSGAPA